MKMRCVLGLVLFVLCMTGVFATCSVDSVQCFVDGMEQNCAAATYGKTVTQVTISSSNYQSDLVTATISRTGPFATSIASGTAVYDTASFKHIWNTTQQMDRSGVYEITATCSPLTCPGPGGITVANGATVYFYPNNIGIDAAACTKEPRVCSAGVLNGTATYSDCYYWSASPFGACTGSCPTGTMTRTVSCMSAETGLAVADIQCAGAIKPATNASCTIACPGSGACGTAAKAYDYYDTTYGSDTLCDINGGSPTPASPAFPNAGTTVTWTCSDANHTAVACTSSRYDGVCGTAASKIYQYSATGFGSDSLCAVGTSNPAVVPFPSPGASQSWICSLAHTGFGVTCSTSRSGTPPAQNGQCGSANGRFFSAADTSFGFYTVCSYGASIPGTVPFPSAGGVSSWICQGTNGGADASCSASREAVTTTNGACGSADGKTYPASASSFGSDTLCAAGSVNPAFVSFPSAGSSVLWSCKGAGSPVGTDDYCSASHASVASTVNGRCSLGTVENACLSGIVDPNFPADTATEYRWTCRGTGTPTGTDDSCLLPKPTTINGVCGDANGRMYAATDTDFGSFALCWSGTLNPASVTFPTQGGSVLWSCMGSGFPSGTTMSCAASRASATTVNGACGASTIENDCADGILDAATPADTATEYKWTCKGAGTPLGTDAVCSLPKPSTINGACGSANSKLYAPTDTGFGADTFCSAGTLSPAAVSFPVQGDSVTWSCLGQGTPVGTTAICGASRDSIATVNGICGNTGENDCTAGILDSVNPPDDATAWRWTCKGNGLPPGADAICSLAKTTENGVCGAVADTCAAGVYSDLPDITGFIQWECLGTGVPTGTDSPLCFESVCVISNGGVEKCGDGIDQDCSGADLLCPTSSICEAYNNGQTYGAGCVPDGNGNYYCTGYGTVSTSDATCCVRGYTTSGTPFCNTRWKYADKRETSPSINPILPGCSGAYAPTTCCAPGFVPGSGFPVNTCVPAGPDNCPADPYKTQPGVCGCGVVEDTDDDDFDGTMNCLDQCPTNPAYSTSPDSDGDGVRDCDDSCPSDPFKTYSAGVCGCGQPDVSNDADFDGVIDCLDQCPTDFNKVNPGSCGCGVVDQTPCPSLCPATCTLGCLPNTATCKSCNSDSQCPDYNSGNYCDASPPAGDGNVWRTTQDRICSTSTFTCVDNGGPVDVIVAACQYGCSGGSCVPCPASCTNGCYDKTTTCKPIVATCPGSCVYGCVPNTATCKSCNADSQCPDQYFGNYCDAPPPAGDGNVWNYRQDRICSTSTWTCENNGGPVDNLVSVCSSGCSGGVCLSCPGSCAYGCIPNTATCKSCNSDSQCPDIYYGDYCDAPPPAGDGNVWNYRQDRYCSTSTWTCENNGGPVDNLKSFCANGCSGGTCI